RLKTIFGQARNLTKPGLKPIELAAPAVSFRAKLKLDCLCAREAINESRAYTRCTRFKNAPSGEGPRHTRDHISPVLRHAKGELGNRTLANARTEEKSERHGVDHHEAKGHPRQFHALGSVCRAQRGADMHSLRHRTTSHSCVVTQGPSVRQRR